MYLESAVLDFQGLLLLFDLTFAIMRFNFTGVNSFHS